MYFLGIFFFKKKQTTEIAKNNWLPVWFSFSFFFSDTPFRERNKYRLVDPTLNYPVQEFVPKQQEGDGFPVSEHANPTTPNIPVDEETGKAQIGLVSGLS